MPTCQTYFLTVPLSFFVLGHAFLREFVETASEIASLFIACVRVGISRSVTLLFTIRAETFSVAFAKIVSLLLGPLEVEVFFPTFCPAALDPFCLHSFVPRLFIPHTSVRTLCKAACRPSASHFAHFFHRSVSCLRNAYSRSLDCRCTTFRRLK